MDGPDDTTGRFAPSPTGDLHLGNLRTALVAWLVARQQRSRFLLRIDDLDPDRSRRDVADRQIADLRAIGIDWDGEPAWQTARRARHDAGVDALLARGLAYPCFCTRAEVRAAAGAPHGGERASGAYPGTCVALDAGEAAARIAAGAAHCLRARAAGAIVTVAPPDRFLGELSGVADDVVVRRRDGVPAYNLATVVDDHDLGVGEVVRGADLADSTIDQTWLASALGLRTPRFAHVPLVLGADGVRLAKRHGAVTLASLAERGVDAAQVVSLLAGSLGLLRAEDRPGTLRAGDLVDRLRPDDLPRADVRIDASRIVPDATWSDVALDLDRPVG